MKARDIRSMSVKDIDNFIATVQEDYLSVRQAVGTGKEKNHSKLSDLRRQISRAMTIQGEILAEENNDNLNKK